MMRFPSVMFACLTALLLYACDEHPENSWQGYAEGDYVRVASMESGIIEEIAVERGDKVRAGTPLFRLETTAEEAASAAAQADLDAAKATLQEAELELKRKLELRRRGNVPQAETDTARARSDRAGAAMLSAAAALDQAKYRLARRESHAPASAIVQDVLFREGETVVAGQPVISLLPPGNIKVRFFVPEAELANLRHGAKVRLACSNCPPDAKGTIRFISTEAEFTPPVIYSDRSKEKLVFMAEATPDAEPEAFRPGQPVTVSLIPPKAE
ncbi:MAG: efflux RND transporter periplasmic adaptor subunit [Parvibaculum sp.]